MHKHIFTFTIDFYIVSTFQIPLQLIGYPGAVMKYTCAVCHCRESNPKLCAFKRFLYPTATAVPIVVKAMTVPSNLVCCQIRVAIAGKELGLLLFTATNSVSSWLHDTRVLCP